MSTWGRHLSSGLAVTSEPASHPTTQEVAMVPNMEEAIPITVLRVTVLVPSNPTLGEVVESKLHSNFLPFRNQLPSSTTVPSDFLLPSPPFLPLPSFPTLYPPKGSGIGLY